MAKKPGVRVPSAALRALILFCLVPFATNVVSAATAVKSWQNTYADITPASQYPFAGRQLADGSVMFVVADGYGLTALRYDADGNRISAMPFYPAQSPREVRIGPFGEIAVLSMTASCASGCSGGNAWVMKYDGLTGRSLWSRPAVLGGGSLSGESPHNLVLDAQGDILAEIQYPNADLTIVKLDGVTGAAKFAPILLQASVIGSIAADAAGNVIVATTTIEDNLHHFETIKYDGQSGAIIWGPVFYNGGLDEDYAQFVAVDATGIVVAGWGTEADGFGATIIKYDPATGETLWGPVRYVDPTAAFAGATQLGLDAAHDVILTLLASPGGPQGEWLLLKYSGSSGTLVWGPTPIAATTNSFFQPHFAVTGNDDIVTDGLEFNGTDYLPTTRRYHHDSGELAWGPETDASATAEVTVLTSDARVVVMYQAFDSSASNWPTAVTSRSAASGSIGWSVTDDETFATGLFRTVDVAATPDGRVAVAGQGNSEFGPDIIVAEYDQATGSTVWGPIVYGPTEYASPAQIAADPAGDIVVLGSRFGGLETILLKYSRFGGFPLWGPAILTGTPARMAIDASGNVAVVATVAGAGQDFSTTLISGATGLPLWGPISFDGGAGLDDFADAVAVSPTGNVFVAGRANAGSGAEAVLLSYSSADGSILWGPVVQPSIVEPGMRLATDGAGNLFLAGTSFHMTTVKYDGSSGAVVWGPEVVGDGLSPTQAHALAIDTNGDVIVTGTMTTFNPPSTYTTVKYAGADGSVAWGPMTFHGPSNGADSALAVRLDDAGSAVVSGTSVNDSALPQVTTLKYDGASGSVLWGPIATPTGMDQTFGGLAVSGNMVFVGTSSTRGMITTAYTELLGIQTSQFDIPGALCGVAYTAAFEAANGEPPYTWTVVSGALPPGLDLSPTGAISGTAQEEGSFAFRAHVEDGAFAAAELDATILVTDASGIAPLVVSDGPGCGWTLSFPGTYASYQWLPGGETTPSIDVTPLEPTTYGLIVGDGNGCFIHAAVVIAGPGCTLTGPTLDSVVPRWGASAGGASVTLGGSNFDAGATFTIGDITGSSITVDSPTQITGLTPSLEAGQLYDVRVINSDALSSTLAQAFLADFSDVPSGDIFHDDIAKITIAGITAGCGGGNYCPAMTVTRAQMAVLLLKALLGPAYAPPGASGSVFLDVHPGDFAADWIEDIAARGITAGCGAGNYCPTSSVTRQQMAVFLLKTEHGSAYLPQPCGNVFGDVACPGLFTDWIEQLYTEGVTGGCSAEPLLFCPTNPVTRGQMAVFLVRTFSLP